ncbi:prolyl hydroxylase family protein [Sphingomicrobium nitratireducens]|uniref:prolyl hydroxylase family protein n=1 Tax=Sphingomicrobium nitratireducens TaxID=2964666 RepID=UPI00224016B5|nr:2OG-Fe(II) oxygenase [Sphingomicrobium nitratireducens]
MVSSSEVRDRLRAAHGVQALPSSRLDLFQVPGFLDADRCAAITKLIDADRQPSTLANDSGEYGFRTSETCHLDDAVEVVDHVETKLSDLLGMPRELGEQIQGQRYAPGQEFKPHTDTFTPGTPDFYRHCAAQGQRTWTAMLFLNEPEAGGATRFKTIGKIVQPETGKLLVWNNLLDDGRPNEATLHQGMKVRKGTKYVITKWYREHPAP